MTFLVGEVDDAVQYEKGREMQLIQNFRSFWANSVRNAVAVGFRLIWTILHPVRPGLLCQRAINLNSCSMTTTTTTK